MQRLFITATGTDIGKTAITALLARQLAASGRRPDVLKPVLSGFDPDRPEGSDAAVLLAATGEAATPATFDRISRWRFAAPLSPDMAAAREGREIVFEDLVNHCLRRAESATGPLLIEGVGGAMVPLDARHTVLDWMAALKFPVLLVSGTYLGAISHCLTTLATIEARGLDVAAILLSTSAASPVDPAETAQTLNRFTSVPIHIVPRLSIDGHGVPELTGAPDLTHLLGFDRT